VKNYEGKEMKLLRAREIVKKGDTFTKDILG
jgi:hypothetical protein